MTDTRCFRCDRRLRSRRAERRGYCATCWKWGLALLESGAQGIPLDRHTLDAMSEVVFWSLGRFHLQGRDLGLLALERRLSEGIERQDRAAVVKVVEVTACVLALSVDALAAPVCVLYHLSRLYALTGRAWTGHVVTLRLGPAVLRAAHRRGRGG